MNTNDIPLAAKLAVLIEAGRAANPDLRQGQCALLVDKWACALGFACLGNGKTRDEVAALGGMSWKAIYSAIGIFDDGLIRSVWTANDRGASLDKIVRDLRARESVAATAL